MKLTQDQLDNISEQIDISPDGLIVLVDVAGRKDIPVEQHCANMFCIDANNEIIWQVSAPLSEHGRDSFVFIDMVGDKILATRFFGSEFSIDKNTGIAVEVGWQK